MAALALTIGGAALGNVALPGGISVLGATLSGAAIGGAAGGIAGSYLDTILFAPAAQRTSGPRLQDLRAMAATEGVAVPRVFGRMRVPTQLIWTARYREEAVVEGQSGSAGGKSTSAPAAAERTTYRYYASFAVGLCEGPIAGIGRIWADGEELRLGSGTRRVYPGTEDQLPDPKISAVQGEADAPAYRGLAYIVFEELPLERYGNRIPQISVEVIRHVAGPDALENLITAMVLIPGSTEFGYDTDPVFATTGIGRSKPENRHADGQLTDVEVSLDQLAMLCPNLQHVSLVVAWHGTDLRCGQCEIRPKVEYSDKPTHGGEWRVSGLDRADAQEVSRSGGSPALGGAPSDGSVVRLIAALKARGWAVTLYPFVMMDIEAGNDLPDPYGRPEQPPFPWRGRITSHPAPGRPGSPDKTFGAAAQVADFFGNAQPEDFEWRPHRQTVDYDGPDEWRFRRLILHYARIAEAAGGVHAFLIGSELVGLTTVRSDADSYPAVAELKALAADVRGIVGPATKISYAADWTEYGPHRPDDGSGDLLFHLDPLWADDDVDFIGIDAYLPLADWREGSDHLDADIAASTLDRAYLQGNVEGGELFDWFYADADARENQERTPISDGAHGEPWVHRIKDLRSWWANPHHNRPGGVRSGSPTAWEPQSKPIRFTEIGCPAVDKGANQPNVFVDPKSSESFVPYFSSGARDDAMQRAYLEALLLYWKDSANNPVSSAYAGRMIDHAAMAVWTWDARPFPEFPDLGKVWSDAGNWRLGHWLTGRLGQCTLAAAVAELCADLDVTIDVLSLRGTVQGFLVDRIMSAREALAPLGTAYQFDACERDSAIVFRHRDASPVFSVTPENLAMDGDRAGLKLVRAQESELPRAAKLKFVDGRHAYRQGAVEARLLTGNTARVEEIDLPLCFDQQQAQGVADGVLSEAHAARERLELSLPPAALALDAADIVALELPERTVLMRVDRIGWEWTRPAEGVRIEDAPLVRRDGEAPDPQVLPPPPRSGPALLEILDLPLLDSEASSQKAYLAAFADPWSPVSVWRSDDAEPPLRPEKLLTAPVTIGVLAADLPEGPAWRWDRVNALLVDIAEGRTLASATEKAVLGGVNAAAIRSPSGAWEILQWRDAELIAPGRYKLSHLLRGQTGTEHAIGDPTETGSRFVVLDRALVQADLPRTALGNELLWAWGPADMPPGDVSWQQGTLAVSGVGLKPLAPVHLRGARDVSTGDWAISWTRRTRVEGDDWAPREVPLGEDAERYALDIVAGPDAVRSVEITTPSFVYSAAMQIADFGVLQETLSVRIAQISRTVGAGAVVRGTIGL